MFYGLAIPSVFSVSEETVLSITDYKIITESINTSNKCPYSTRALYAPNIPDSDTMATTDQQRHLNKRGNIEYGPVGFGIRLTKPKGPRTMPQHFGNFFFLWKIDILVPETHQTHLIC